MGVLRFYHVTRGAVEDTLPKLLERALDAGSRVQVRSGDAARAEALDARLWLVPEDGFLPHGVAGGAHDALQPVLIDPGPRLAPGIDCLMVLDGAAVTADEVRALQRTFVIFDGQDDAAVSRGGATVPSQCSVWRSLTLLLIRCFLYPKSLVLAAGW